ncbi:ABC transporter permease [Tessaracoccus caeni]|uniref:ABC transporter permease n=1 Tax=Tessaracoccus caeni TaxID=3031239 RepID=UPI0023DCEB83|nr:hypothetical protein [Tessaracoccus caeni]MDF1488587.1 hypothetical protein [Tessaracoccus caeni]
MSATAVARHAAPLSPLESRPRDGLAGFGTLLLFALRRDRIRFWAWTLGVAMMSGYFASVLSIVFPEPEDLQLFAAMTANPGAALLIGPGFGDHEPAVDIFLSSTYGIYLFIGAGIMSILTVSRHTRVEEQTGRAELVRANVVGRLTPLTVALKVAAAMNVLVAVLVGLLLTGMGFEPAGSFLLGAAIAAVGLAFAGITATCVQLTEFSRTGSGLAGAILGGGFLVRGLGDISASHGGGVGWLSWLSPIGWSQKAMPFGDDDWRPLLLALACFFVFGGLGYLLQTRRDVGAGLVPARRGRPYAAGWLSSPIALAARLQLASVVGWSASLFAGGLAYGGFTQSIIDGFRDAPKEVLIILGGEDSLLDGYLGLMGSLMGFVVVIYAILAVQGFATEEADGRAEPVLATAVGRGRWLGSWVAVTALGVVVLQVAAGLGNAVGTASSMGSAEFFGVIMAGHLIQIPAIWAVLGVAVLLCGQRPRLAGLAWVLFGYSFLLGFFGPLMEAPEWAMRISPFEHIGRYPGEEVPYVAMVVLIVVTALMITGGLALFRRRDLTSV